MVDIMPFRALRYAHPFSDPLSSVVAPPYDVIGPAELKQLWERSQHNVVRLIRPAADLPAAERERGYHLAPERLRTWKKEGVLVPDDRPSLYFYRQRFRLSGGQMRTRHGFFALVRLTEWGEGVFRHELTLPGPVSDRVRLLGACQANLSPVFGLYSDPEQEVTGLLVEGSEDVPPIGEVQDDHGVWHGLWQVSDPAIIGRVVAFLRERSVVIADGHHRYTAALQYRNSCRAAGHADGEAIPSDYALFYLGALEDPGLAILPTHQVLHGLAGFTPEGFRALMEDHFSIKEEQDPAAVLDGLTESQDALLGAVVQGGPGYLLRAARPENPAAPEEALDVSLLRRYAVEPLLRHYDAVGNLEGHLRYTHDAAEAAGWVRAGEANVAFIVRSTPLEQVRTVALARRVMPQKSTYFHPKPLTGLVFFDHLSPWEAYTPQA